MFNATPFLKLYARYRAGQISSLNQVKTQEDQLFHLIAKARATRFGQDHGFSKIWSVEDYQTNVPLRTYEQFWNEYWQKDFPKHDNITWPGVTPFFAVSSGTSSGVTKYIPFTPEMQRSNTRAGLDLLVYHLQNRPHSAIFGGRSFMLGGSTDLVEQSPGIFSGDLSGIAVKTLPWWARARYFPDQRTALLKDWEEKISILTEQSLVSDIRMISGVPSWMLIFFDKLFARKPDLEALIKNFYPNLEMLVHGGVRFSPYLNQFKDLLKGSNAELREVYPASEGFIAIADRGSDEGLRLNLDNQIFFEFVPVDELNSENPTRYWIKNVEPDVNYAIVLTTCAGLWSYILGDTVRFIEREPARILITGRTSYYLSAFGEHLIAEEIDDAVSHSAATLGVTLTDYCVAPLYPQSAGELGGHIYCIEPSEAGASLNIEQFADLLDQRLCKRNEDYEAHRARGFGLKAPTIKILNPGTFAEWMKSRGKFGGQNKVPRIITDQKLLDSLLKFVTG
jgi:hypothetical protein